MGIKAFSAIWVTIGHYYSINSAAVDNAQIAFYSLNEWGSQLISGGVYAVDSFFAIR